MELKLTELTKSFGTHTAVDHVSCVMTSGVYGLLGVNGAGKTTLMRMLCTLLSPTGGSAAYDGADIFTLDAEYRRILGYLPQDFGFYPDFTVEEYLLYIASIKGLRPAVAKRRMEELTEQVGLTAARRKKMKRLSGGMRRRAGIAQAMLNNPKILILDEPTAGLDPNERIRFRNLLSELAAERLVLLSTHIVSDVEYIAKEILLMKDGRFHAGGTADQLIAGMGDKVWRVTVDSREAESYLRQYKVANIKSVNGSAVLRVLSETRPTETAQEEAPALEDVFLYYFGESSGEGNDEI